MATTFHCQLLLQLTATALVGFRIVSIMCAQVRRAELTVFSSYIPITTPTLLSNEKTINLGEDGRRKHVFPNHIFFLHLGTKDKGRIFNTRNKRH